MRAHPGQNDYFVKVREDRNLNSCKKKKHFNGNAPLIDQFWKHCFACEHDILIVVFKDLTQRSSKKQYFAGEQCRGYN